METPKEDVLEHWRVLLMTVEMMAVRTRMVFLMAAHWVNLTKSDSLTGMHLAVMMVVMTADWIEMVL